MWPPGTHPAGPHCNRRLTFFSPAEIHEMFVEGVPLRKWRGHKTQVERDLEIITGRPAVF